MSKLIPVYLILVFLSFAPECYSDIVTDTITFDGGSGDPDVVSTFADGTATINVDQNSPTGTNGSQAIEFDQVVGAGNFSGGIVGGLDLSINPLITSGGITASDLDLFTFSIDSHLVSGPQIMGGFGAIRIEPLGGGFDQKINLPFTFTQGSTFQSFSFDLANAAPAEQSAFVNRLNENDSTEIQFVFDFSTANASTIRFDNIQLSTSVAVPEPSSVCWLFLVAAATFTRRRRIS